MWWATGSHWCQAPTRPPRTCTACCTTGGWPAPRRRLGRATVSAPPGTPTLFAALGRRFLGPEIGSVEIATSVDGKATRRCDLIGRRRITKEELSVRVTVDRLLRQFPGAGQPRLLLPDRGRGLTRWCSTSATARSGRCSGPLGLYEIDAICISHLHADHCLDLCGYWVARTYRPDGPPPRIPVYGPSGTAAADGARVRPRPRARYDRRRSTSAPCAAAPTRSGRSASRPR